MAKCGLCGRELGTVLVEDHHLIPKTFKGSETKPVHKICHRFLHATISEREMANYYHTFERILERDEIQAFVKWVQKKDPAYYSGTDESATRRRNRRR
jgi:hypothetical protein